MDISLTHTKNPLLGWDIQVTANAGADETITFARIDVNGFPESKKDIDPPVNKWQESLTQLGQYPGENKVLVTIRNNNQVESTAEDNWG